MFSSKIAAFFIAAGALLSVSHAQAESARSDVVYGSSSEEYIYNADRGEIFHVVLSGDGDTDLDLFVYDRSHNLVCESTGMSDYERCRIFSRQGGRYTIKVTNLGNVWNAFEMRIPSSTD